MDGITVTDYDTLRQVVRSRRMSLGMSQLDLDEKAGLQNGYTGKIEAGIRNFGATSLPCLLGALGIVLVPMLAPSKHDAKLLGESDFLQLPKEKIKKEWRSMGGKKRNLLLSPKRRFLIARKAARARWDKVKAERERGSVSSEVMA